MKITEFKTEEWFKSRGLRVLDYQKDILDVKLEAIYTNTLPTVLAACPSAGKTIMSICFIDKFIIKNPNSRVLVLTHGTTVLKTQYLEELDKIKPGFSYTGVENKTKNPKEQVLVGLPQTISKKDLGKFDLIVIDEAHHFYTAPMVQDIIKKATPKYQLLLTGTPSSFIRKEYPIIPVTVNQLLDHDMVSDVIVELASSTYNFKVEDYNLDYELKDEVKFLQKETDKTLDKLLGVIEKRLTSIFKNDPVKCAIVNQVVGWNDAFKSLSKTMIACKNQSQAKQVKKYFEKKGIKTALSISDNDLDSGEMTKFKNEKDCLVLIVVQRGILGFNYPELESVIDMTTSQNIDRIFQLMARVLRKHPKDKQKLFFKIAPYYLEQYFEFIMTCVLCLTDEEYYTKFNGKNFLDLEIPIVKLKEDKLEKKPKANKNSDSITKKKREIKSIEYVGLPAIRLFKDILHKNNKVLSSYAFVKLSEIRNILINDKNTWTLENCKLDALQFTSRSEWVATNSGAYGAARKNGWLGKCCEHMKLLHRSKYSYAEIAKIALQYKTRTEWSKQNNNSYAVAVRNKWLDKCCAHMIGKRKPWSKEECLKEAKSFKLVGEWCRKSGGSYDAARRNGWIVECTKHMIK